MRPQLGEHVLVALWGCGPHSVQVVVPHLQRYIVWLMIAWVFQFFIYEPLVLQALRSHWLCCCAHKTDHV